jgi:hypothetical protein
MRSYLSYIESLRRAAHGDTEIFDILNLRFENLRFEIETHWEFFKSRVWYRSLRDFSFETSYLEGVQPGRTIVTSQL